MDDHVTKPIRAEAPVQALLQAGRRRDLQRHRRRTGAQMPMAQRHAAAIA
jgi:hypothetical protein